MQTREVKVTIQLAGVFRSGRGKEEICSYPSGVTPREVVADLRLSAHLLGIVVINDVHAGIDDLLQDGDTLSRYPLLDGG